MDLFDKEKRSWIMARIKGKDTKPEILVRSIVHRCGFRSSKNRADLPGCPDIVLPKYRKIIFVHGCFWHGHKNCKRASRPSSNKSFWRKKLDANILRDRKNVLLLRAQGWKILIVWQCQMRGTARLISRIEHFLVSNGAK